MGRGPANENPSMGFPTLLTRGVTPRLNCTASVARLRNKLSPESDDVIGYEALASAHEFDNTLTLADAAAAKN
jgi:hypothetical protein